MEELEKAKNYSAPSDVRQVALARFYKQIEAWGIALPETEPLVLDFGLGQFESIGLIEIWIANEVDSIPQVFTLDNTEIRLYFQQFQERLNTYKQMANI